MPAAIVVIIVLIVLLATGRELRISAEDLAEPAGGAASRGTRR
jgi:hypothetical protein